MLQIPNYISIVFLFTVLIAIGFIYRASRSNKPFLIVLLCWVILQSVLGYSQFYVNFISVPPRFILAVLPPVLTICFLLFSRKGKLFLNSLDQKILTLLHVVRIPVELVLYWLFLNKQVPELMTFAGRNLDILSGLTAPLIYYFYFMKKSMKPWIFLVWNLVCLGLLFTIVVNAIFSAPFSFQQFAFDQPNRAVFYFPFNLLPSVVVPIVLFSHVALIRQTILKLSST
jgi:hypothetical protein